MERDQCGNEHPTVPQSSDSSDDATLAANGGRSTFSTRRRGVNLGARASARHVEKIDGWVCTEEVGALGFVVVRTLERDGVQICISSTDVTTFPVSPKLVAFLTAGPR